MKNMEMECINLKEWCHGLGLDTIMFGVHSRYQAAPYVARTWEKRLELYVARSGRVSSALYTTVRTCLCSQHCTETQAEKIRKNNAEDAQAFNLSKKVDKTAMSFRESGSLRSNLGKSPLKTHRSLHLSLEVWEGRRMFKAQNFQLYQLLQSWLLWAPLHNDPGLLVHVIAMVGSTVSFIRGEYLLLQYLGCCFPLEQHSVLVPDGQPC